MRSFLGVPIFVRGVVYGDLYLAEKDGGEFTEEDEEIVTLLAAQTGITIEKVQIHEGAVHWIRQLEALDELTHSVLEERDVSRLLELVARRLRELIGAREVLISASRILGRSSRRRRRRRGRRRPGRLRHPCRIEARPGLRARAERAHRLDPRGSRGQSGPCGPIRQLTAILVPLMFQGRAIGVISAFNKDGADPRFTDDDLRLAEAVGTRAALAVHLSERVARETVDAILEAQEAERSRIARELHDETGSALTAVLLGLAAIEGAATLPEARQASAALRETASSALESVGRLAFALRPAALDEFGLVPALKGLGGGLEELGGPKVEFEIDLPAGMRLPAELETALFRITQEALTNVVKHAEAKTARVILTCRKRSVHSRGRG